LNKFRSFLYIKLRILLIKRPSFFQGSCHEQSYCLHVLHHRTFLQKSSCCVKALRCKSKCRVPQSKGRTIFIVYVKPPKMSQSVWKIKNIHLLFSIYYWPPIIKIICFNFEKQNTFCILRTLSKQNFGKLFLQKRFSPYFCFLCVGPLPFFLHQLILKKL